MAHGVITDIGRKKLCRAHAGEISLSAITYMGFGDKGIDAFGSVVSVTGREETMGNELLRKQIESHRILSEQVATCRYTVKLMREELANKKISELALFDLDGDMVAYKTFLAKGKDSDMEFIFDMDEIF